jgi:hypothetical protein
VSKSRFNHDIKRGNGQAYLTLFEANDRNYYKNELLKACLRVDTLSTQDEPGRADYLFRMIELYNEVDFFESAIIARLKNPGVEYGLFFQLTDLLTLFGKAGYHKSHLHLWSLYHQMNESILMNRLPWRFGNEKFEQLAGCIEQIEGFSAIEKITDDYLKIRMSTTLRYFDLESFYFLASFRYGKSIVRKHLKQRGLDDQIWSTRIKSTQNERISGLSFQEYVEHPEQNNIGQIMRLAKLMSPAELDRLFLMVKTEPDYNRKLSLLKIFGYNTHPIDMQYVTDLLHQGNNETPNELYQVLSKRPSLLVYNYFKNGLCEPEYHLNILILMCISFNHDDEDFLIKAVKSIKDKYDLHQLYSYALLDLFDRDPKAPKALIEHYYHEGICSYCRLRLVKTMHRRKLLGANDIKVLLNDCNSETVEFARKIFIRY